MPLQKIVLKSGVNQENTRYTNEGVWYECDKIRFRQGTPEKIGGWTRIAEERFPGICRSLWNWVTLTGQNYTGVGTSKGFYIESRGTFYDITPFGAINTLDPDPFTTMEDDTYIVVTDSNFDEGTYGSGFVTFNGAEEFAGVTLNGYYKIYPPLTSNSYRIRVVVPPTASESGGGSTVTAGYELPDGNDIAEAFAGWNAGGWNIGNWGGDSSPTGNDFTKLRLWSQSNFGEDLIFGPRGGKIYYWAGTNALETRAVPLTGTNIPTQQQFILVSDIERFVFAFGGNEYNTSTIDPMYIQWSNQGSATNWTATPAGTAGFIRLSRGTAIIAARQARQEILVWTDSSLYSLQYAGAPTLWTAQLVGDNISIASQNCVAYAGGVAYWMGRDKFYKYDGNTQSLRCDLRKYIFNDLNTIQYDQVFAGTNESFHEIWWFYCSSESTIVDRYVIYNYLEDIWYYGNMSRSAWLDSALRGKPLAAVYRYVGTADVVSVGNLVNHEDGVDDNETEEPKAISAFIASGEFDVDEGQQFSFIWRMLPDLRFTGSTTTAPRAIMTLSPLDNSGSGYNNPASEGGDSSATITRSAVMPIEEFTGQIYTRVRGRQFVMRIESDGLGVTWQLGSPRVDMRPDGRR